MLEFQIGDIQEGYSLYKYPQTEGTWNLKHFLS